MKGDGRSLGVGWRGGKGLGMLCAKKKKIERERIKKFK